MSQSNAIDPSCAECVAAADIDVSTQTSNSHQHRHEQQLQVPEDIMDPSTFRPMSLDQGPAIFIEYCDRCRWAPRASWISTELFLTFPTPIIGSITLIPTMEHGGRFRVWLKMPARSGSESEQHEREKMELLWDRKVEGGFPELKILKQRVRNFVKPEQDLGHSDAKKESSNPPSITTTTTTTE